MPRQTMFFPGIVQISGTMMPSVSSSLNQRANTTANLSGNLNVRRKGQRKRYRDLLTGNVFMIDVGETPPSGSNAATTPATVPSWANRYVDGRSRAFVSRVLSSSLGHDTNTYFSGSTPLENTPVPASASLMYEKQSRLQTKTYKVSGSAALTSSLMVLSNNPDGVSHGPFFGPGVTGTFVAASGVLLSRYNVSGVSVTNQTLWFVPIDVPDYGRIRDIKVWVEIAHDGNANAIVTNLQETGLGSLKLALQSPNVKGFFSVPSWNDQSFFGLFYQPSQATLVAQKAIGNSLSILGSPVESQPDYYFYKDSFILWDGSHFNLTSNTSGSYSKSQVIDSQVPVWDTDRHIRTVFSDSSPNRNPRHIDLIYDATGSQVSSETVLSGSSPCVSGSAPTGTLESLGLGRAWGSQYPWFADTRLNGLNIPAITGSVPQGWLTGPNGTANTNEFPTQGGNLGPNTIRPVYPLLDDVIEVARIPTGSQSTAPFQFTGRRPGLRGSEMNGRWFLMVYDFGSPFNQTPNPSLGVYFRQVRLEITYDQNRPPSFSINSKDRRHRKRNVTRRPGLQPLYIQRDSTGYTLTGSFGPGGVYTGVSFGHNLTQTFVEVGEQYGFSVGITDNTGSQTEFAVFTRLTGALADRLSASASLSVSGTSHALYSYLHNQFGTPYIPISSGSAFGTSFQYFNTSDLPTKTIISEILRSRPSLPQAHRLRDTVTRLGGAQRMSDIIQQRIQEEIAALSSGSS